MGKDFFYPSSSCVLSNSEKEIILILTARTKENFSKLFKLNLNLSSKEKKISGPILELGEKGAFDEKGTSYPCVVNYKNSKKLFYTGWSNNSGNAYLNRLAMTSMDKKSSEKTFLNIKSKKEKITEIGSIDIKYFNEIFYMFFTRFNSWKDKNPNYNFSVARSDNLEDWIHEESFNLDQINGTESGMICKPSIIKHGSIFYMFFCHRIITSDYKIGFASSSNFFNWKLVNKNIFADLDLQNWCKKGQSYPNILFNKFNNTFYLFFAGNAFGEDGFGFAKFNDSFFLKND
mgnify:CR=1 FL=1